MKTFKIKYLLIFKLFLALLLAIIIISFLILKSSVTDYNQILTLDNTDAQIEIIRDSNAIPHIYSSTIGDAYFGLGFAHAQDRLWQLEMMRSAVRGELSEIFGADTLDMDKLTRTVNSAKIATLSLARIDEKTATNFQRYIDGINSYIKNRKGLLPPEFLLFDAKPKPWIIEDCFALYALIALGADNWQQELQRTIMLQHLTREQLEDLYPDYPKSGIITHSNINNTKSTSQAADNQAINNHEPRITLNIPNVDTILSLIEQPLIKSFPASNTWVVSGERTQSGLPILASDPHGPIKAPADYYLAHLSGPSFDITGVGYVGMPVFAIGHNQHIAWGITDIIADRADLFWEQPIADKPGYYKTKEGELPFIIHQETIKVKGQEAVVIDIRNTLHGPVISDVQETAIKLINDKSPELILVLSEPTFFHGNTSSQAFMEISHAQNWQQFTQAMEKYELAHNFSYADIYGNIGMISPAKVPIRNNNNGFLISKGWNDSNASKAYLNNLNILKSFNPTDGFLVNSNNKIEPWDYPFFISKEHVPPYRASRIKEQLSQQLQTIESSEQLQNDVISLAAKQLLPLLLNSTPNSEKAKQVISLLAKWDGSMDKNTIEPLIYSTWERELSRLLYQDELADSFTQYFASRPEVIVPLLTQNTNWCDDIRSNTTETCEHMLSLSLEQSISFLENNYGDDMKDWIWRDAHQALFANNIFTHIPLVNSFSDIKIANSGGPHTVNQARTTYSDEQPFAQNYGPRYRQIIDLSDRTNSRYMIAPGVSENIFSPYYSHLAKDWGEGKYFKMPYNKAEMIEENIGITLLSKFQY